MVPVIITKMKAPGRESGRQALLAAGGRGRNMRDFLTALGLVLVIEGILCAGFPGRLRDAMRLATELGDGMMRRLGLGCAVIGVTVVAIVRHWL